VHDHPSIMSPEHAFGQLARPLSLTG
jgi:hypothetical protein